MCQQSPAAAAGQQFGAPHLTRPGLQRSPGESRPCWWHATVLDDPASSWPGLLLASNERTFLCCSHMGADRLLPGKEGGAQAGRGRQMTSGLVRTGCVLRLPLCCYRWCGSKLGGMPAQLVWDGGSSPLLAESLSELCVCRISDRSLAAEAWQPTTRCPSASLGKPVATGLTNKLWSPCRQTCWSDTAQHRDLAL